MSDTMRHLPWLFILLAVGCTSKPQGKSDEQETRRDKEQARKALKAQAEEIGRSAVEQDHAKMAKLTHPALIEMLGGHSAYIKALELAASDVNKHGVQLKSVTIGEPSGIVPVANQLYAIVPTESQLITRTGVIGKQPSYFIAVSADEGATWKFVDGFGVHSDRSKLKILFPEFPEQIQLPAAQRAVWNKK